MTAQQCTLLKKNCESFVKMMLWNCHCENQCFRCCAHLIIAFRTLDWDSDDVATADAGATGTIMTSFSQCQKLYRYGNKCRLRGFDYRGQTRRCSCHRPSRHRNRKSASASASASASVSASVSVFVFASLSFSGIQARRRKVPCGSSPRSQ